MGPESIVGAVGAACTGLPSVLSLGLDGSPANDAIEGDCGMDATLSELEMETVMLGGARD